MGPVGRGWGVRVGCLACTGTPGPTPHPRQSCPEQHKTGFEWKKGREHSPRGAEPVTSCSGSQSPTPRTEVSVTWRVRGIDGGTLAGSQGAAGTGFLSKNSLAARLLGRASQGPRFAAARVGGVGVGGSTGSRGGQEEA